ncbi:MAG: tetratricopeptide repeat protein [Deltaproteobacteria bacterium]|nr:tetratricopeptide repeat protein [Myxococcales bacterium]MDP3215521.1 tetratricopeptide repeat protein [Deltaproteobacteria bacterium]
MKSTREILVTSALVLAALCQAPSASAQVNEARVAFQAGVQSYAEQRYAEALESFRTAYRIRPHPSVLVNIANCYVALNRPQDAISTFERFLNDPTVAPTPQQRTEIETALTEARRHLATINVLVFPPGAEVYLDGDLVGTAPLRRPLQTGPGPHVIEARQAGGGTVQHQARVEGGGTVTLTLDIVRNRSFIGSVAPEVQPPAPVAVVTPPPPVVAAVPAPVVVPATNVNVTPPVVRVEPARVPPTPPLLPVARRVTGPSVSVTPPRDDGSSRPVGIGPAFWTGLALTVAGAGTAIGFYVYSNSLEDDYYRIVAVFEGETDPSRQSYYRALGLSYADAVDQNRLISYIAGGVAGAAAVFTIGAAVYGAVARETPRRASLQVLPSLRGDGLTLSGTF